jgi:hypothetical protein
MWPGFDVSSPADSYIVVQPDQVALTETLLRMLCISIPHMPKTSVTFAQELSKLLLPMIGRPGGKLSVSSGSSPVCTQDPLRHLSRQTLEETVACYCIVVRHVTEEYGRVASILTSCITKLQRYQDACDSGKEPSAQEQKSIPFFIVISSLMVSSCDLDNVKADRAGKPKAAYPSPQTLIYCRAYRPIFYPRKMVSGKFYAKFALAFCSPSRYPGIRETIRLWAVAQLVGANLGHRNPSCYHTGT